MMDSGNENRFREITIPGDVLCDGRLSDGAKIMYGKISRLSLKTGFCPAGNSFLDGTISGRNASRFIAELKESGYIVIENEKSKYRKIFICPIDSMAYPADADGDSTSPNLAGSNSPDASYLSGKPGTYSTEEKIYPANSGAVDKNDNSTSPDLAGFEHLPRQIRRSYETTSPNLADKQVVVVDIYKNTTTTKPPESSSEPAPADENILAASSIKNALLKLNNTLIFDNLFYNKAALFMYDNGLDINYLSWLYRHCLLKEPKYFNGFYYTLFTKDNIAEEYKAGSASVKNDDRVTPRIYCPVCGAVRVNDTCPSCGLPEFPSEKDLFYYQKLYSFPPEKREDFINKQKSIFKEFENNKDFKYFGVMLRKLEHEFGLIYETSP